MSNLNVKLKVRNNNNSKVKHKLINHNNHLQTRPSKEKSNEKGKLSVILPGIKQQHNNSYLNIIPNSSQQLTSNVYSFNNSINSSNSKAGIPYKAANTSNEEKLKEANINLLNEKKYLTTEVQKLLKNLDQKNKIIKELTYDHNDNTYSELQERVKENFLVENLKRQIKELQTYTKIKEEELERLKKNTKVTKLTEVLEELEVYKSEFLKLKSYTVNLEEKIIILKENAQYNINIIKSLQSKLILEESKVIKLTKYF